MPVVNNPYATVCLALAVILLAACGERRQRGKEQPPGEQVLPAPSVATEAPPVSASTMQSGKLVYDQYCASCHQSNGRGVPNLNPPLAGTDYVTGDKDRLIRIVLAGSNEGLEVNGMVYSNAMPANAFLSDSEVASVLSYIRNSFGNQADTVTVEEVGRVRASL